MKKIRRARFVKKDGSQSIKRLKKVIALMEEIVVVTDKIGSGFEESERTAAALLLFFNQRNVLDKLAITRAYLVRELAFRLSRKEFDEFIEADNVLYWEPPYEKTAEEMLKMVNVI